MLLPDKLIERLRAHARGQRHGGLRFFLLCVFEKVGHTPAD
jgi:hypothetical protein